MKKFILILAVIAVAIAQESCKGKTEQKVDDEKLVIDTLAEAPVLNLDSICND